MKCEFCGHTPERKINRRCENRIDTDGNIQVVEPRQMIDYAYYECHCGMRYTPEEMGEPRETWQVFVLKGG